jgi:tetratricopeptide (TPR) repeat protein
MKTVDPKKTTANDQEPPGGTTETIIPTPNEPTVIMQAPPTVVRDGEGWMLKQKQIEEILAKAKKQLAAEDFRQASQTLDSLLQTEPHLDAAKVLREQIQSAAAQHAQIIFDEGIRFYVGSDWDSAISTWQKILTTAPNDSTATEWIQKAEVKREQERIIRAGLLRELERCGKLLSERNFVIAEEYLESLKDRFTGGFRLGDLHKIYEALMVRTRVALEREFEDLRDNAISTPVPIPTKREPHSPESLLLKQYLEAFESGKKFFEKEDWEKALAMWQKARTINPGDGNLIHWIALAESHVIQAPLKPKQTPVRSTIAFLSVFVVTALITFYAYQKYQNYIQETKNHDLIQRAVEYYRAGRLEESWKTLQLYLLQDPNNETARQLLERITIEMRVRQTTENKQIEIALMLQNADQQKAFSHYEEALKSYESILKKDPGNVEAQQNFDDLKRLTASKETVEKINILLDDANSFWKQRKLSEALEKINQVLYLDPSNTSARNLKNSIETERISLNTLSIQLETATYLNERGQKEAAVMMLNRILSIEPSQPQARQLLSKIRGNPNLPRFAIEIRIQPPARLFIDGRDVGSRDYFNELESAGTHVLHIERVGYHNIDQVIEVKSGDKNTFTFQLKAY